MTPARRRFIVSSCIAALSLVAPVAYAQDGGGVDAGDPDMPPPGVGCPAGAIGCARAPIAYSHRVGLPVEFDVDTGWWPAGSPVQVRFRSALTGHTLVEAAGQLEAAWPMPMVLRTPPTAGTGVLQTDYGIVLDARVRLHLDVAGTPYDWEGSVPYIPHIDFRAMAGTTFDPWMWTSVSATGSTMRQHLADIPLTDAFISIPGVSGGLSFDAQADLATSYRSTRITFGGDADPITESADHVMALFSAGPWVDYFPRLEGEVDQTISLHIFPALYVSLLGRRWTVDLFDLPVDIGPITQPWLFDAVHTHLLLPDVQRRDVVVDFGVVRVGETAMDGVPFDSIGDVNLWVQSPPTAAPFTFPRGAAIVPPHSTVTLPVRFAPTTEGPFEQRVPFLTNDPDTPAVYITVRGVGMALPDAGFPEAGAYDAGARYDASDAGDAGTGAIRPGCGCRVLDGGGSSRSANAWLVFGAIAMAFGTRRRKAAPLWPQKKIHREPGRGCLYGAATVR